MKAKLFHISSDSVVFAEGEINSWLSKNDSAYIVSGYVVSSVLVLLYKEQWAKGSRDENKGSSRRTDSIKDSPACPSCGGAMRTKSARQTGALFWGCVRFPECRGTRDLSSEDKDRLAGEDWSSSGTDSDIPF